MKVLAGDVREVEAEVEGRTVREVMEALDLDPERFLSFKDGSPLPDDAPAADGMELVRVVAGG